MVLQTVFFSDWRPRKQNFILCVARLGIYSDWDKIFFLKIDFPFLGISRLRGTTLYELFLTLQQRGLNWYHSANRGAKDILSVFQVQKKSGLEKGIHILSNFLKIVLLKYSSDEIIPFSCKCSIFLGLTFVEIKKSFTKMHLIFRS